MPKKIYVVFLKFYQKSQFFLIFSVLCISVFSKTANSQDQFPGKNWKKYAHPEKAGWDTKKIAEAESFADSINTAAFLLVENGIVIKSYGDIYRRYMCHSVRKSLLSALFGIYESKGFINKHKTIAELGIDDKDTLTSVEKQAKIIDLLKARSGIYHPAAYETAGMAAARPERQSHAPGAFWYYNNWDFNTLGYIFRQETGEDIFEAFKNSIADKIGMQDFEPYHGYYHLEAQHSIYPAYPFRMSARDMARFGLLFEKNGKWKNQQVIPEAWISESCTSYSDVNTSPGAGYGYMWWILGDEFDEFGGGYSALGYGGHTITVLPEQDIVFVHRTNTYSSTLISTENAMKIMKILLSGRTEKKEVNPEIIPLINPEEKRKHILPEELMDQYKGSYTYPSGYTIDIKKIDGQLRVTDPRFGSFNLIAENDTGFVYEDAFHTAFFTEIGDSIFFGTERIINTEGYFLMNENRLNEAITLFKLNTIFFPNSYNVFDSMGEIYMAAGDTVQSIKHYIKSVELNPHNLTGLWALLQTGAEGYGEIKLSNKELQPFTGHYTFQNQDIHFQAESDSLFLIAPDGRKIMRLIPVSKTSFMLSGGEHYKINFGEKQEEYTEFDLISKTGIAGIGIRNKEN